MSRVLVRAVGVALMTVAATVLAGCEGEARPRASATSTRPDLDDARPFPSVTLPSPATSTTAPEEEDDGTFADSIKPGWEVGAVAGKVPVPSSEPVTCPKATVTVIGPKDLAAALAMAAPGDVIGLRPGTYSKEFSTTRSGTPAKPIWLCGPAAAVLDGGNPRGGYVLHLDGASFWRLVGFTVANGQKGVMADGVQRSVIQGLSVRQIGDEAIHLRRHSSDNVVLGNRISGTGLRRDKFGEGVYVGSAMSNWCNISDCQPDRSDRNVIRGNTISGTAAEGVDVKEGTTGGRVLENSFDGAGMTGGDSWVDVKGDAWLVEGNTGVDSPLDGFQTHQILPGWGERNLFRDNVANVNAQGYGFAFRPLADNVVTCDNVVHAALSGPSIGGCR